MIEFLTALLVVVTTFYAWISYRMLRANEKVIDAMHAQSEAIYRPYISCRPFLEPDNPIFYLKISNRGKTAASDLRLTIDRSFFKFGEQGEQRDISSFSIFNEPIDSLPPESEITFALAQSFIIFAKNADDALCPTKFTINAQYKFGSIEVSENHIIDLRPYLHADVPQDPTIRKLKAINDSLSQINKTLGK